MTLAARFLLATLLLTPISVQAQVLITEVQPDPTSTNDDGEWIEIQNSGGAPVSIAGWTLNDYTGAGAATETATRWAFPAGAMLAAGQVIVVAKFASATGYADNTPAGLYTTPPNYECATNNHDDTNVPNLTPTMGNAQITLSNAGTGDAVVLRDNAGTVVSAVEWGSVDRTVAGTPAATPGSAQSLSRIGNTGDSSVDFMVTATPTPGTVPTVSGGPQIAATGGTPRHITHGDQLTVSATITDPQGVASARVLQAAATASVGAASGNYTPTALTHGAGNFWSTMINPSGGAAPTTFHDVYVRLFLNAADTTAATSTSPAGATKDAANSAFVFRNIMPTSPSSIAEIRAETGPTASWLKHSARVEGVVLTARTAFTANRTNFFIMSQTTSDAIRVFSTPIIPDAVVPGDIVRVTGMIDQFNGLRQIGEPSLTVEVIGTTATIAPTVHTISDVLANGEQLESQLIRINGLTFVTPIGSWPVNMDVPVSDGTGMLVVRISAITDLANANTPVGSFDLVGILGQFAASGVGGYQLLPRNSGDVFGTIPPPTDAGAPADAAASTDTGDQGDAGIPNADAADQDVLFPVDGAEPPDAGGGGNPDATASNADAAAHSDGSSSHPDASGGVKGASSGCGCNTAGQSSDAASGALLLLIGLAFFRTRRPTRVV